MGFERSLVWKLWAAAFAVRLAGVALGIGFFPAWLLPPDTASAYLPIAQNLAAGLGYGTGGNPNSTIPPLFPCWLAVLMQAAGPELPLWLPGLFHAAFRATCVVLVYLLAHRYFGPRAAFLAALLYLLDPWEAFWAGFVMKEPLAVLLCLLAVWLLLRLDDQRSLRSAAAAGAVIGLATLARFPNCGLWIASFLLLFRLKDRPGGWSGPNLRHTVVLSLALTFALFAVLSPWLLRNWMRVGQPILSAHFAGQYFFTSNGPGIEMVKDGYYSPRGGDSAIYGRAYQKGLWQKEGYLFSYTLDYLLHHPAETGQRILAKAFNMWQPTFAGSSQHNGLILGLPYCVDMLCCLTGLAVAWRRRLACPALAIPLGFFFVLHLIYWGEIRNRQYLTPLLFAFGGLALDWLSQSSLVSEVWSGVRRFPTAAFGFSCFSLPRWLPGSGPTPERQREETETEEIKCGRGELPHSRPNVKTQETKAAIPGLISTLTTVRNAAPFLRDAIDSLLAQTDNHFEVIVVDDGSSDETAEILARYSDPRLRVAILPPVGRVPALIHAAGLARGELYAQLDADDVALPHRLARQRAFLDAHPEVALVGGRAIEFDGVSEWMRPTPAGPAAVRRALGMYNPFYCSSLMFRRTVFDEVGGFRIQDGWGHDLSFLIRVAARHRVDILAEPVIRYRRHPGQISSSRMWERDQRPRAARLQLRAAWKLGLPAPLWVYPLAAWLYACLPPGLRPRGWKQIVKGWLMQRCAKPNG